VAVGEGGEWVKHQDSQEFSLSAGLKTPNKKTNEAK
jgi:hypothetical protein